ncbi:hypothetical protein Nepgr_029537 [Nepenthes gracilis]|uniref:Uncharacterized protein n=1 Tax=Nepenthes gracilis TaxID=150966 RepID=A0AAD3TEL2_NEPGR|nr:hypothetical protein Nepgr_029537 [Nepenthes gracilis]
MQYSSESYNSEQPISPPENYPIPEAELGCASKNILLYNYGKLSVEETKELLEITRNTVEVLSSLINSAVKPNLSNVRYVGHQRCSNGRENGGTIAADFAGGSVEPSSNK